ncbi:MULTISPECIES: MFS transporter [unclassified Brevibacterium]|uniref:MFS transporter n=1 Tax=unclassified Brevibacterium TaxID=2614124 RepID=UPI0008BDF62A|nr:MULTISPECIES: MFS transporter [unclassified Brevibacterium]OFL67225.1 hypothetical protein HMPREF2757_11015 [Brevibacterium sp. HMSC063G07]
MTPSRLWNKDFVLAFSISLMGSLVFYLLLTSMAAYAVISFGAGHAAAGFASSSFVLGAVVSRVPAGKYLDFVGRRRTILLSSIAQIALSLLYIPTASLDLFIVVRFLHGFAFGFNHTATSAAVQTVIPPHRRAEGTGYFGMATSLAMASGPFLAVTISAKHGYQPLFYICAAIAVVASLLSLLLTLPESPPSREQRADKWRLTPSSLLELNTLKTASVMFAAGLVYSVIMAFLGSYAEAVGAPEAAGWFFVALAAAMLICRSFVGRLQDKYGHGWVIYPAILIYAASLAVLTFAHGAPAIIVAGALVGAGFGSLLPAVQAACAADALPARYGVVMSTFFIMLDSGTALGSVVLGALEPVLGQRGMFGVSAFIVLAGLVVYWASRRGRKS